MHGLGNEFRELRHYSAGDDIRLIDWKRSAHQQNPLVKVFYPESHQKIYIALDISRKMSVKSEGRTALDRACDIVATFSRLAIEQEDNVSLIAFSSDIHLETRCSGTKQHRINILEQLRALKARSDEANYDNLAKCLLKKRTRSLIVVVSSISNHTTYELCYQPLLRIARRHSVILSSSEDSDVSSKLLQAVKNIDQAYIAGSCFEYKNSIKTRLNTFQHMGIEVAHGNYENVSTQTLTKYSQLKAHKGL